MRANQQRTEDPYEIAETPCEASPAESGATAVGDHADLPAGEDWSYLSQIPQPKKARDLSRWRLIFIFAIGGIVTAAALSRFPASSDAFVDPPMPVRRHSVPVPAVAPDPPAASLSAVEPASAMAPARAVTTEAVSRVENAPKQRVASLSHEPADERAKNAAATVTVKPSAPARRLKLIDPGVYRPASWGGDAARHTAAPARVWLASADTHPEAGLVTAAPATPWNGLRQGMTKDEVSALLGGPRWTERSVAFEFWMYEENSSLGTGVVVFENGAVYSWRLPSKAVALR